MKHPLRVWMLKILQLLINHYIPIEHVLGINVVGATKAWQGYPEACHDTTHLRV
jgi:hypothetical protein